MRSNENGFYHRRDPDGSYGSICYNCFLSTGSSETEGEAESMEKEHICDQIQLIKREAFRAHYRPPDHWGSERLRAPRK